MSDLESIKKVSESEKETLASEDQKNKALALKYDFEAKILKEQIKTLESDRALKKEYGQKLFKFVCVWSSLIFLVIILNKWIFSLEKEVLISLIVGTSGSVISILHFMTKGLFDKKENNN